MLSVVAIAFLSVSVVALSVRCARLRNDLRESYCAYAGAIDQVHRLARPQCDQ